MGIVLRYAFLLGLGLASIFTYVSAGAVTWERLATTSGYTIQEPADAGFVVLAFIGIIGLASLVKFVVSGFPSMIRHWYDRRKGQIATLMIGCVIWFVFLVT